MSLVAQMTELMVTPLLSVSLYQTRERGTSTLWAVSVFKGNYTKITRMCFHFPRLRWPSLRVQRKLGNAPPPTENPISWLGHCVAWCQSSYSESKIRGHWGTITTCATMIGGVSGIQSCTVGSRLDLPLRLPPTQAQVFAAVFCLFSSILLSPLI